MEERYLFTLVAVVAMLAVILLSMCIAASQPAPIGYGLEYTMNAVWNHSVVVP